MFSKLRLLLDVFFLVATIIVSAVFALSNEQPVFVDFVLFEQQAPLGVMILLVFIAGGLLGFLVRLPSSWALKAKLSQSQKKLARELQTK